MKDLLQKTISVAVLVAMGLINQSCSSSDVGGNEDKISPAVTLTSLNSGEEVIGDYTITWTTDEINKSTVEIRLSYDSGATYDYVVDTSAPDTGSYVWHTNDIASLEDCRHCRLRIVARDVVGNSSTAVESAQDFIINNVPQVIGAAVYYDPDSNGPDDGDTIVVPFDKDVELRTGIASDIFIVPVLGDSIGPFATVARGSRSNELIITMNGLVTFAGHLHIGKTFDPQRLHRTAPSGFNVRDNLSGGILFAPDTGRTAAAAEGIDITPAFSDSGQAIGSELTTSITVGDVDSDGDQDIVESTLSGIRVWLNNGSGVFPGSANQSIAVTAISSIALGDVDGDSDLDIVVGRHSNNPNYVYTNNGSGVFSNSGQSLGATYTQSIQLGDLDGDGDLDMVEGNFGQPNRVLMNNGINSGTFINSGQSLGNSYTNAIVLGDLDGDDDLDMIEGNQNQAKHVWLNNGTGTYTDSGQIFSANNTVALAIGDVDGDGNLDFVEGRNGNLPSLIWHNDGNGLFTDSGQLIDSVQTSSVILVDVDSDDDLDFIQGQFGMPSVEWLNNGNGVFIDADRQIGNDNDNYYVDSIAVADLDGDFDLDLVLGENGANQVWWNSLRTPPRNQIYIDSGQLLGDSSTIRTALGDLDADGDLDMIECNGVNETGKVWLFNATGGYTVTAQVLDANMSSIAIGDVDGDGDLDFVAGFTSDIPKKVWLNNGAGVFTDSGQSLGAVSTYSIELVDIDNDGDLDMFESGYTHPTRVWRNNGVGVFSDSGQSLGSAPSAIFARDVDGVNGVDLIVGDLTNVISVWLNNGNGVYSAGPVTGSVTSSIASIISGDIDADGYPDLIVGREENSTLVLYNNRSGLFIDSGQVLGTNFFIDAISSSSLALGDVDVDGDADLIQQNSGNEPTRVWINNGVGRFSSGQSLGAGGGPISMGDVDNDGDPDIVEARSGANQVWLNDY
jgi:hypothetical protein